MISFVCTLVIGPTPCVLLGTFLNEFPSADVESSGARNANDRDRRRASRSGAVLAGHLHPGRRAGRRHRRRPHPRLRSERPGLPRRPPLDQRPSDFGQWTLADRHVSSKCDDRLPSHHSVVFSCRFMVEFRLESLTLFHN